MDKVLAEAERLLYQKDYRAAAELVRGAEPSDDNELQFARRRFLAWALLACGETKRAYELFWSCAHHEGARAGILLLTVLAGQVETAIGNFQRYCDQLSRPPAELPDSNWHAANVVGAALQILERYPFAGKSRERGAAAIYRALLFQTQGNAPGSFEALGQVSDFYPPARLLRDRWMDKLLCFPLPKRPEAASVPPSPEQGGGKFGELAVRTPQEAVARAAHILLYPDQGILQKQCAQALREGRYIDALEVLRRLLFLDPHHTQSLETRWRLYMKLEEVEAAKDDLFYLIDLYEREKQIVECQKVADQAVKLFPDDERALLKMCFLQARLGAPTHLALYGRKLLRLCLQQGLHERAASYRRWLLRQRLSLDDRTEFEVG